MSTVKVRDVIIGEGLPKICVPIVSAAREEILKRAAALETCPADLAEWRADRFSGGTDREQVKDVLVSLRAALKDIPLLFTFRTAKEGGAAALNPEDYTALLKEAIHSGAVDLVDVELLRGDAVVKELVREARSCGVKVLISNHDFDKTPSREEIIYRLRRMQDLGADILKIAVMPQSKEDVLTLLGATEEMNRIYADCPVVTMSMSGEGVLSRFSGEFFGSAMTFGTAGEASAPGQPDAEDLKTVLKIFHKNM